jgi:Ca2+-binding EF-hand superfamily protein
LQASQVSLVDAFDSFDTDGDRRIDAKELEAGLRRMMPRLNAEQMRWLLELCDSDGDGSVDVFEFSEAIGGMQRTATAKLSLAKRSAQFWGEEPEKVSASAPAGFAVDEQSVPVPAQAPRSDFEWRTSVPERASVAESLAKTHGLKDSLVGQWICVFYDGEDDRYGKVTGFDPDQDAHEIAWAEDGAADSGSVGWIFDLQSDDYKVVTSSQVQKVAGTSALSRAERRTQQPQPEPVPESAPKPEPELGPEPEPILRGQDDSGRKSRAERATELRQRSSEHKAAQLSPALPVSEALDIEEDERAQSNPQLHAIEFALGSSPYLRSRWDELAADKETAFSTLDGDGDGVVTLSELRAAFPGASGQGQLHGHGVEPHQPQSLASYARQLDMSSPSPSLLSALPPTLAATKSSLRPPGSGYSSLMQQRRTRSALEREMASYRLSNVKAGLKAGDQLSRDRARREAMARKSESLVSTISSSSTGLTPRASPSPRLTVAAKSSAVDVLAADR